jgi:hypothetical protein
VNVTDSLAATLGVFNEVIFYGRPLPQSGEAVAWIAGRQVKSGAQAGMFAPTDDDYQQGVALFTGEKLRTKLAARNVLTAEAARALALAGGESTEIQDALAHANRWLFGQCFSRSCTVGECAHSTVGLMRYLAVAKLDDAEQRLVGHVNVLSEHRDGKGRWKRFPFYYTLLALTEIALPAAIAELRYAAPACARALARLMGDDRFSSRRRVILQKALE